MFRCRVCQLDLFIALAYDLDDDRSQTQGEPGSKPQPSASENNDVKLLHLWQPMAHLSGLPHETGGPRKRVRQQGQGLIENGGPTAKARARAGKVRQIQELRQGQVQGEPLAFASTRPGHLRRDRDQGHQGSQEIRFLRGLPHRHAKRGRPAEAWTP